MRALLAAAALALLGLAACGNGDESAESVAAQHDGPPVRIGTKNFTEQFILGELYAQALRAEGFPVQLKSNVGSSEIIHQAYEAGALDMYPEYVGVLLSEIADLEERPRDATAAYRAAKRFEERDGSTLLEMTPFSDQNALAVRPAYAEREGVRTIADLRDVEGTPAIGAPPEFATRFEGLLGLRELYGLDDVEAVPLAIGQQYGALDEDRVDVAAVFTTDGQLAEERYVLLEDPEVVFATQHLAPVITQAILREHGPRLRETIDAVSSRLTTEAMREMNAAVDLDDREPAAVADEFLRARRLK